MTDACPKCGGRSDRPGKRCRECRRKGSVNRPTQTKRRGASGPRRAVYLALSEREWVALYNHQGGACYICRTPLMNRYAPGSTEGQLAYLDHDHKLEKEVGLRGSIRGLLCLWCNRRILVTLHDSVDKAQNAADYLRLPPARQLFGFELLKERCDG